MLEAYHDGSTSDDSAFITLVGITAPKEMWPRFEQQWGDILERKHLEYWHTADAMSPHSGRDFVKPDWRDRWTLDLSRQAMVDLRGVVFDFLNKDRSNGFQLRSCTVNMDDYRQAKTRNDFLRTAEAICVDPVCGGIQYPVGALVQMFFDNNEAYMKEIEQVWTKDKNKALVEWAKRVDKISSVNSRTVLPLQAADLFAWSDNHTWQDNIVTGLQISKIREGFFYYDLARIEDEFTPERERTRAIGIRRAGRKTHETRRLDEGSF